MIGASKILTVSYGTFSCTLEGFDEPFNTMKAIAEYFRDLAAEDRYFGAEPPTPDAAMLHRIAEREIQRRVEAKIDANGVVLRAGDVDTSVPQTARSGPQMPEMLAPAVMAPAVTAPAVVVPETLAAHINAADAPVADTAFAEVGPQNVAPADTLGAFPDAASEVAVDATGDEPAAPSLSATIPEGVAAKLARIRQSVAAQTPVVPATVVALAAEDEYSEDEHAALAFAPASDFSVSDFAAEDFGDAELANDIAEQASEPTAFVHEDTGGDVEPNDATLPEPDAEVPEQAEVYAADPADADGGTYEEIFVQIVTVETAFIQYADANADAEAEAEAEADDTPSTPVLLESVPSEDMVAATASDDDILGTLAMPLADQPDNDDTQAAEPMSAAHNDDDAMLGALAASLSGDTDGDQDITPDPDTIPAAPDAVSDDLSALISTLSGDTAQDDLYDDAQDAGPIYDPADFDADLTSKAADADTVETLVAETPDVNGFAADLFADDPEVDLSEDTFFVAPATDEGSVEAASVATQRPTADLHPAPPVADKAQRARARVIKIRRADAPITPAAPVPQTADLSPEAEAALQAELGLMALDAASDLTAPDPQPGPDAARMMDAAAEDAAVARLLRQADTEMAVDENRRRLSAIAHLKAAVAATVADRKVGAPSGPSEEQRIDPYREDLARAVRPQRRRNEQPRAAQERPAGDRPAPLILVSEQRIDRAPVPVAAPAAASLVIRPRRISNNATPAQTEMRTVSAQRPVPLDLDEEEDDDTGNIFADAKGFAEFAERMGATHLPDLMEAAAAYVACVEKREHFSRPQLMRRIGALGAPGELSREDGLISFGTLLRTGRFAKVRRGQYALSEDSDYLAEAKRIAK